MCLQVNLLSNAVKFTEEGEVILQARCVDLDDKAVTLEFSCRGSHPLSRLSLYLKATEVRKLFIRLDWSLASSFRGTVVCFDTSFSPLPDFSGRLGATEVTQLISCLMRLNGSERGKRLQSSLCLPAHYPRTSALTLQQLL